MASVQPKQRPRQRTACDRCRITKKGCNGKMPCFRCLQSKNKICTYKNSVLEKKKSIPYDFHQLQVKFHNLATRRRYFEAFFSGMAPAVLFQRDIFTISRYDNPCTDAEKIQFNAIFASSLRSFHAPTEIYKIFENRANEFAVSISAQHPSFHVALAYHLLSIYYWGENPQLCAHYRYKATETCDYALQLNPSFEEQRNLLCLKLISYGIQDLDNPQQVQQTLTAEIPLEMQNFSFELGFSPIINFTMFHSLIAGNLFPKRDTQGNYYFLPITPELYEEILRGLKGTRDSLIPTVPHNPTGLLVLGAYTFLRGLLEYLTRNPSVPFNYFYFEKGVELFSTNDYLIGLGGPRFIEFFNAAFHACFLEKGFHLANRIAGLQRIQATLFSTAIPLVRENMKLLSLCDQVK